MTAQKTLHQFLGSTSWCFWVELQQWFTSTVRICVYDLCGSLLLCVCVILQSFLVFLKFQGLLCSSYIHLGEWYTYHYKWYLIIFNSHEIRSPSVFRYCTCTLMWESLGLTCMGGLRWASMGSTGPFHADIPSPHSSTWLSGKASLRLWRKSSWFGSHFSYWMMEGWQYIIVILPVTLPLKPYHLGGVNSSPKTPPQSLQHTGLRGSVLDP